MAACEWCSQVFSNRQQIGPHRRVCSLRPAVPVIGTPVLAGRSAGGTAVPVVRPRRLPLCELAQRPMKKWGREQDVAMNNAPATTSATRDLREMQAQWGQYVGDTHACCSSEFWDVFKTVQKQTAACRDDVLRVVKKFSPNPRKWPISTRSLVQKVETYAGKFWPYVTETHVIDLQQFGFQHCKSVSVSFMDPIFVWLQCCNALVADGHDLHWDPKILTHPDTLEPVYGAGIQYGLLLRSAAESLPQEGKPALFSLSWDGGNTGYGSRSSVPICVQVMNVNCASLHGVGLLGYMPHLEVSDARRQDPDVAHARWYVTQKVIGLILRCLEECAKDGFLGIIGGKTMRLYPRLGALALDTPERVKYFGLRSQRACGICRFRSGRSASRSATRHNDALIATLYNNVNSTATSRHVRKVSRQSLNRYGFKYDRRCELLDNVKHALVHVNNYPDTLYGGLIRYERMHVYFINYCTYLMELLAKCVPANCYDAVSSSVRQCHQFRDTLTGVTHPRLRSVLKMTHLTAERRVRAIFYWAHVLGTRALVIVEPCRVHAQVAVSTLQLLLVATRGHRAYTLEELNTIFRQVGTQFFRSMEQISSHLERQRVHRMAELHLRNPQRHRAPNPFKRTRRYELNACVNVYVHILTYAVHFLHMCSLLTYMQIR